MSSPSTKVQALLARGVVIPHPGSVLVADDVDVQRIAPGVTIHPGCRLSGSRLSIGPDSELGAEAPAVVENCQLGRAVELKGGFFSGSTFLDQSNMGGGAHVRPGCLLEEESGGAHTVGLKQTILMPYTVLGSLVNFCDILMAGGTSRKNHGEVGSSYIHFNFTPHQDKATASLVGDVPRGVMLDQAPNFLGGQGGLVGPARIGFGNILPAGTIWRGDALEDGNILSARPVRESAPRPYDPRIYRGVARIFAANLHYIGNLRALQAWYRQVRKSFMQGDPFARACYDGALSRIEECLAERIKRLQEFTAKLPTSISALPQGHPERTVQEAVVAAWPDLATAVGQEPGPAVGERYRDIFLEALGKAKGGPYLAVIPGLAVEQRRAGSAWLQSMVEHVTAQWRPESAKGT